MRVESLPSIADPSASDRFSAASPVRPPVKADSPSPVKTAASVAVNAFGQEKDVAEAQEAIKAFNKAIEPSGLSLKFSQDEDSGQVVIAVIDQAGKTLRQIPTEETLKLSTALSKLQGLAVDIKV